jgi:hypothetical protein
MAVLEIPAAEGRQRQEDDRIVGTQMRFFLRAMRDGFRGLRGRPPVFPHNSQPLFGTQLRSFIRALHRAH